MAVGKVVPQRLTPVVEAPRALQEPGVQVLGVTEVIRPAVLVELPVGTVLRLAAGRLPQAAQERLAVLRVALGAMVPIPRQAAAQVVG